jgi:hypothetical protein
LLWQEEEAEQFPEAGDWIGDLADGLARAWLERKSIGPDDSDAASEPLRLPPDHPRGNSGAENRLLADSIYQCDHLHC